MRRAIEIRTEGEWDPASAIDAVLLDADERHCRRVVLTGEKGERFLLDLAEAASLRHGDGLLLDDGAIVRVEGRPEPLTVIAAADATALARLAWHLGNRHVGVQIAGERLRIRRDHVIEDMLRGLGAMLTSIDAVFEPERGAYEHGHARGRIAGHDHGHGGHHEHGDG
jgi:urease accessory protein